MAPYLGTLTAVPAGLLGSLLVSLIVRRDRDTPTADAAGRARSADTVEPTNILPPLDKGSRQRPAAATAAATPRTAPASGASVPRQDAHVDWVSGLSRQPGSTLPRRVPGERFPAGT
jgi:hypothetical protein